MALLMSSELNSDLAVQAEGLSKVYRIYNHPRDRLLQSLWGKRRRFYREFWALRHVSFEVARGETLGIVGRNGSGKSTLLQLLCGTLTPSCGNMHVRGRIGALLELGSGFNPEFTGRENVYLNGALLGLSQRQINERLDKILAFADIGQFIDQPVKAYSSGMVVRLAFAVQAHIDPDILVVDEALAVGDELFQKKCYAHLECLKERGTSILLVTHSCPQIIQHCDQAILLHQGRLRLWGKPQHVTVIYQRLSNAPDQEWDQALGVAKEGTASRESLENIAEMQGPPGAEQKPISPRETNPAQPQPRTWLDPTLKPSSTQIYPSRGARIENVSILSRDGDEANVLPFGEEIQIRFDYFADEAISNIQCFCTLSNHRGSRVTGQSFPSTPKGMETAAAKSTWSITYRFRQGLWPGVYFVCGGISKEDDTAQFIHRVIDIKAFRIISDSAVMQMGSCDLSAGPAILEWTNTARIITPSQQLILTESEAGT